MQILTVICVIFTSPICSSVLTLYGKFVHDTVRACSSVLLGFLCVFSQDSGMYGHSNGVYAQIFHNSLFPGS